MATYNYFTIHSRYSIIRKYTTTHASVLFFVVDYKDDHDSSDHDDDDDDTMDRVILVVPVSQLMRDWVSPTLVEFPWKFSHSPTGGQPLGRPMRVRVLLPSQMRRRTNQQTPPATAPLNLRLLPINPVTIPVNHRLLHLCPATAPVNRRLLPISPHSVSKSARPSLLGMEEPSLMVKRVAVRPRVLFRHVLIQLFQPKVLERV